MAIGQLFVSYSPTGGMGTKFVVEVNTKEEAAIRIRQAKNGQLLIPRNSNDIWQPVNWNAPVFFDLQGLPAEWVPWLKMKFDWFDGHN